MKSYRELVALLEAKHAIPTYGDWGIITKDGRIVDGTTHPTHSQHIDLSSSGRDWDNAEYFYHRPTDSLIIRTWSANSLGNAIKHFNKLPHGKTGVVWVEHSSRDAGPDGHKEDFQGKRHEVLPKLKALHAKLTKGSLTER